MNVLVVTRVYSGLADSLANGQWRPRGVPAVYRLLEGLAERRDIRPSYVFLSRDPDPRFTRTMHRPLAPLGDRVWVLPWRSWPLFDRLGVGNALREAEQAIRVVIIAWRSRADVAYCTNAAYVAASLLARLRIAPVVMRFLGIFPVHKEMAEHRGHRLARWLYRARFAKAICTLEGSGAEYYLPKLLDARVPCEVLLNGVDRPAVDAATAATLRARFSPDGWPIVTFLGRFEPSKGCEEFVDALIGLQALKPGRFRGLMIGTGSLSAQIEQRLAAAGLTAQVHLTGALAHRDVADHLAASDIYVSLNRFGNLSNANLEALIAGRCMLVLESDPVAHIDEVTDRLIPRSIVERISRRDTAPTLTKVLARLIDDSNEICRRADATARLAETLLVDWRTRVSREIATIMEAGVVFPSDTRKEAETVE